MDGAPNPYSRRLVTDQNTTLSTETMRRIIDNLDESISLMDRHTGRHTIDEIKIKSMLITLRRQLLLCFARQVENADEI